MCLGFAPCRPRVAEAAAGAEAGAIREEVGEAVSPPAPAKGAAVGSPILLLPTRAEGAVAVAIAAQPRRQAPPREEHSPSPQFMRPPLPGGVVTLAWLRDEANRRRPRRRQGPPREGDTFSRRFRRPPLPGGVSTLSRLRDEASR